jgi:hypothetical protein
MKKAFLFLTAIMIIGACVSAQAQCLTEHDSGICDSLILKPYRVVSVAGDTYHTYPAFATVEILVSHDIVEPLDDSIAGFVVPIAYTSSNVATFCSTSDYWNNTTMLDLLPDVARSIFRHLPSMQDIQIRNRMLDLNGAASGYQGGWDFVVLDLGDKVSRFWFTCVPTGTADQRWGDGNRVLLATMTFLAGGATEICMDTTFWPPGSRLDFDNTHAEGYVPKVNLPLCFQVTFSDVRELHGSDENRPSGFSLGQNYPNPFNPVTNIGFTVAHTAQVRLDVYNIVGQKVKTLLDQEMKPGAYSADWDGTDQGGKAVSSGIYFYRMEAGDFAGMKKMLLLK